MFAFAYRCPLCPRIAFQTKSEFTLRAGLRHSIVLLLRMVFKNIIYSRHIIISMDSSILFNPIG